MFFKVLKFGWEVLFSAVGHVDHVTGEELFGNLAQAIGAVFASFVAQEKLLTVGRKILHNPFIAVINQRNNINFCLTISGIKQSFLLFLGISYAVLKFLER